MSPGTSSFYNYSDYTERGEHFKTLVKSMLINKIKNTFDFFDSRGLDNIFLVSITSLLLIGLVMITSSTADFAARKFSNPLFFLINI